MGLARLTRIKNKTKVTRFYQAGGEGSGVVGSPWFGAAFFLNDILPGRPWLTNRLAPGDKFRRALRRRRRDPIPVVIFQREGAREPQKMGEYPPPRNTDVPFSASTL